MWIGIAISSAFGLLGLVGMYYFWKKPRKGKLTLILRSVTYLGELKKEVEKELGDGSRVEMNIVNPDKDLTEHLTGNTSDSARSWVKIQDISNISILEYVLSNSSNKDILLEVYSEKVSLELPNTVKLIKSYVVGKSDGLDFNTEDDREEGVVNLKFDLIKDDEGVRFKIWVEGELTEKNKPELKARVGNAYVDYKDETGLFIKSRYKIIPRIIGSLMFITYITGMLLLNLTPYEWFGFSFLFVAGILLWVWIGSLALIY